jgi:hypothetical protein
MALGSVGLSLFVAPGVASAADLPAAPMNIVTFPNRDMVVLEGYDDHDGKNVNIKVYRGTELMGAASGKIAAGAEFEVNHPGGACWGNGTGFPQVTPDILPGDRIVVELEENGQFFEQAESVVQGGAATRMNYTAGATTLTVTGTVPDGVRPADVEQRIVNPELTDTPVARRDLRALVSDTMQPGPRGGYTSRLEINADGTFTAYYDFADSAADAAAVAEAAGTGGGERFMNWQLTDAAGNRQGLTIAEMGEPGGPGMGGCPAGPSGVTPTAGSYGVVWSDGTAQVSWSPAAAQPGAAPVTGYSVEAVQKTATNGEFGVIGKRTGTAATRATLSGLAGGTANWNIEVRALTATGVGPAFPAASGSGGPGGGTPDPDPDTTAPTVTSSRNAAGAVVLTPSEASADVYYTTDGSSPLENGGLPSETAVLYTAPIAITAPTTLRWVAFDLAGNHSTPTEVETFTPPAAPDATAPAAPVGVTARPGNGSIALSWTAPANTGGAAVTGYSVKVTSPAGTGATPAPAVDTTLTVTGPATTVTVPNLTNGREYTFTVAATNRVGTGPVSAEAKARPGDVLTAALVRNRANDKRIGGSGSQSGVTVRVYQTNNAANVGNTAAAGTISLGTATVTPAAAPATGIEWELRIRTGAALPAGAIIWVQSTGGGITSFRV